MNIGLDISSATGGLLLSVQDSAAFELSDQVAQPDLGNSGLANSDSASNLLSSGKLKVRCKRSAW